MLKLSIRLFVMLWVIGAFNSAHAKQFAVVINERAIIYSDELMSSPVGYVSQGKKLEVGSIARNKAQVYPIVVSGKIAYIRVIDVSTEREAVDSSRLSAERFTRRTEHEYKTRYTLSYVNYATQVSLTRDNGNLKNNDPLNWNGISIRGDALVNKKWDLVILTNFFAAKQGVEEFKMVEVGAGGAYRVIEKGKFLMRVEAQFLGVPFISYAYGSDFRKNSFGFTMGGGLNLSQQFNDSWGIEATGGLYYTKISSFASPRPYQPITPSFMGTRLGLGLLYRY